MGKDTRVRYRLKGWVVLALVGLLGTVAHVPAGLAADVDKATETSDKRFLNAYRAARDGRILALTALKPLVFDHPLYPYVVYADLRRRFEHAGDDEIERFLTTYQDTPLAARVQRRWLERLGKQGRWQDFVDHFDGEGSITLRCHWVTARLKLGGDESLQQDVRELWLSGRSLPDECDAPFDWLIRRGGVNPTLAWQRIKLAHQFSERRLAKYLTRYLPASERRWEARLRTIYVNVTGGLDAAQHWPDSEYARDIIVLGLRRLAPADPASAWDYLQNLSPRMSFSEEQKALAHHRIALMAATDYLPDALDWLSSIPAAYVDDQVRQWRVRVALRARNWSHALSLLDQLSAADQQDIRWRYWRGRVLDALGRNDEAFLLFEQIAREPNFHGFLASDYLRLPYSLCPASIEVDDDVLFRSSEHPALIRALMLFRVEMYTEARREWRYGLAGKDVAFRRHAALLAHRAGWHDRAILTLADTGDWRLYDLRFPTQYDELVQREARRNGLNPAWVFGIMRAESAFVHDARSSAGAMGLMQLTPTTGREVSRRNKLPLSGSAELYVPERNIPLGTAHLRELLEEFGGNPVLATAAYNAGPTPVKRWLAEHPGGSADLWIETIPYSETRSYVGTVMAFAAVYDWRLDDKIRPLSHKMPPIGSSAPDDGREVGVVCRAE